MNPCVDYKGNSFPSLTAMCRAYGMSVPAYVSRKNRGWTLERILSTPLGKGAKGYAHFAERNACYKELNKEKIREYQRQYRERNKQKSSNCK